jgi:aldehyde oxidoreductase
MALMEEFLPGKGENLHDYLIPSAGDMPPVESILIEDPSSIGPFGAKGIGEQAVIPTAPAILNAIHDAIGVRIRRVPATPDRIRAAIRNRVTPASRRPHGRAGRPPDSRRDAGATAAQTEQRHA